jgi:tRNA U54 and U55 pseudouridine synthase Pus10
LWLSAEDVTLFKLDIKTQAGTYIKEFVHGDFGRTQPSLGQLLGGVHVDILALDVQVACQDTFSFLHGALTLIHTHICNCYIFLKCSF